MTSDWDTNGMRLSRQDDERSLIIVLRKVGKHVIGDVTLSDLIMGVHYSFNIIVDL